MRTRQPTVTCSERRDAYARKCIRKALRTERVTRPRRETGESSFRILPLGRTIDNFANPLRFLRRKFLSIEEGHHEPFGRTPKGGADHSARDCLQTAFARYRGAVVEDLPFRAILEPAFIDQPG